MVDPRDLVAQNDGHGPETVVLLPTGSLVGLHVRGVPGHVILGIREDREGRPVSCAVVNEMHIDTSQPLISNPRRVPDPTNGDEA